jgi:hypothetical protein
MVPDAKCAEETWPEAMEPDTIALFASMPLLMAPLAGGKIVPEAKWADDTCPEPIDPECTAPSPMNPELMDPDVTALPGTTVVTVIMLSAMSARKRSQLT